MPGLLDERLTTSQAARIAGVSDQTIRLWMRSGQLAHERTPLGALIDRNALERFLAERTAERKG
jgi:excisionase family DNA binding protein